VTTSSRASVISRRDLTRIVDVTEGDLALVEVS